MTWTSRSLVPVPFASTTVSRVKNRVKMNNPVSRFRSRKMILGSKNTSAWNSLDPAQCAEVVPLRCSLTRLLQDNKSIRLHHSLTRQTFTGRRKKTPLICAPRTLKVSVVSWSVESTIKMGSSFSLSIRILPLNVKSMLEKVAHHVS